MPTLQRHRRSVTASGAQFSTNAFSSNSISSSNITSKQWRHQRSAAPALLEGVLQWLWVRGHQ